MPKLNSDTCCSKIAVYLYLLLFSNQLNNNHNHDAVMDDTRTMKAFMVPWFSANISMHLAYCIYSI